MRSGPSSTRPPSSFNTPGPSQNARVPCRTDRLAEPSSLPCPCRGWRADHGQRRWHPWNRRRCSRLPLLDSIN